MSQFFDQASLVMVPSGYKNGKVYSQKPLSTDGELTFSRASTATRVNASGLIEEVASGVPRLDYSGGASCPSLLLEPQRTNHVRNNTDLTSWVLTTAGDSFALTAGTSPDGTNNAIKLVPSTTNAGHLFFDSLTNIATSGSFVMSCYAKADGLTKFGVRESQSVGYYATFDLSTGTVIEGGASTTASIVSMGNGWYRCIAVVSASINACLGLVPLPTDYTTGNPFGFGYAGNGTDGVLVYQPQLEVNATYATSPIATTGVISATRVADAASKTGISSLIGQTEGTIYAEVDFDSSVDTEGYIVRIDESSFDDTVFVARGGDKILSGVLRSGGSTIAQLQKTAFNGVNKLAFAYKSGSFALYVNGTQVATSAATYTNGITYDDIRIGGFNATTANMCGGVKQTLLFKTRLSNADLATLTA